MYNYPIHLYDEDATGRRPSGLEELVTFRHEGFYDEPDWEEKMPAREPLKRWIRERLLKHN
jgi:N-acyl-L-homoserine lactone synthetase